jgi:NAD(P)-dependent dehydrogenase (short-subunit alcohol dehydrogenase family)
MSFTNQVAVIIGATGTLGPTVARAFVQAGAKLALVGTQTEPLEALRRELGLRESTALYSLAATFDEAEMNALADAVRIKFGRIDFLIHLLGTFVGGTFLETPNENWDYLFQRNVMSAVNAIRAFLPLMMKNESGRIITTSSGLTQNPPIKTTAYVSVKAALETMTLALAKEIQENGITANVVLIRSLDTPTEREKQPEKTTGWVKPEDVAATLLFLCSEQAASITGARIPVTGGN